MKYYSNVHDREIHSYEVNIDKKIIVLHTDGGFIKFNNILVHHFEDTTYQNIISDIYEVEIQDFIEEYRDILQSKKNKCWPVDYENEEDLANYIKNNLYIIFYIDSSIGLHGFVIGSDVKIEIQS